MPINNEGRADDSDTGQDVPLEAEAELNVVEQQDGSEQAERLIGDVSIEEWIRSGFKDFEALPQIRDANELKRVLELKGMERDSISTYRNWLKSGKNFPENEFSALMEYFADNWLLRSNDLKRKAPEEWGNKFGDIIEMMAYRIDLPQQWLEASTHARFMCGYNPEHDINQLRESVLSRSRIREMITRRLYQESEISGLPIDVDEDELERQVELRENKNSVIFANAAKLAEVNGIPFDDDIDAQIQANSRSK